MKAIAFALSLLTVPSLLAQDNTPAIFESVAQPTQSRILYDVQLAIIAEPALQIDGAYIDASVDEDHFVTLKGAVPDQATRAYAEDRINHVPGVRWVMNNLQIGRLVIVPGPAAR